MSRSIFVAANGIISFFLWLSNILLCIYTILCGFPGGASGIKPTSNTGNTIPGLGRSPEGGHGNPLQYSCLENPMDRGAWQTVVHRAAKSQTRLKWLSMHTPFFMHSSVDGPLGCLCILAIINSASVNIGVHISFQIVVFSGHLPKSGIVGSHDSSLVF